MHPIQAWKRLSAKTILECPAFRVEQARMQAPESLDKREGDYYRLATGDWVNVVALDEEGRMLMIRQYRHGTETLTLELPGGRVDPGEDPAEAARRELLEETGYQASSLKKLGALRPNPALMTNTAHSFLAEGCRKVSETQNDPNEETLPVLIPVPEIPQRIQSGEIDHAIMVAALNLWQNRKEALTKAP